MAPAACVAAVLACVPAIFAADRPRDPQPEAKVDVVVRDRHGRIVRDLEADDFAVTDGAAKLAVVGAKLVEGGGSGAARLVSLIFQRMSSGESAEISRDAALAIVAGARGSVDFAVFEIDKKLSVLQPFTRDPKAVRAAIEQATGKKRQGKAAAAPAEASTKELTETVGRILRTGGRAANGSQAPPSLTSLLAIAAGQGKEPGRKAAGYFTEGLPIADTNEDSFRTIVSAANLAHVSIYTVDVSGLATSNEEDRARALLTQSMMTSSVPGELHAVGLPMEAYAMTDARPSASHRGPAPPEVLEELAARTGGFIVSRGDAIHGAMRHILEDLSAYYEVTYAPLNAGLDGRYHSLHVAAKRDKLKLQDRNGYYAMPDLPGASILPYELPLLDILHREPVRDFPHRVALFRYRSEEDARQLLDAAIEVRGQDMQFDEDGSSGLSSAHVTMLGIVRDRDGNIVDRFSGDAPLQYPHLLMDEMRKRPMLFQAHLDLAPGDYTLETAIEDTLAGKFSTGKTEFAVAAPSRDFGVSSLAVVRSVIVSSEDAGDGGMFALAGKSVVPALDGAVAGGKGAFAKVYFRLYPQPGATMPIDLDFNVLKDGKRVVHSPLRVDDRDPKALAPVISLDVGSLEPGDYDVRLTSKQGDHRAEEQVRLAIRPAAAEAPVTHGAAETGADGGVEEVPAESIADLPSAPPTPEQERLLEQTRDAALKYTEKLPNFLCTQVTRRMLDPNGKGRWRALDENAQLITFFEGREHYQQLSARSRASSESALPPSLTSSGEYGSLLKEIFVPEAHATFKWSRTDNIRGRPVEVLAYSVEAAHSRYSVSYHGGANKAPVFSAYHGLLFVDGNTGAVMRLTHETGPLPADMPMHRIGLVVDYGYTAIGGQLYLVPVAASLEVQHRKNTVIRNEVSFRAYQRFSVDSRVLGYQPSL